MTMTASEMGKKGGKKSAENRFKGKTKEEISEAMREIRYTPKQIEEMDKMAEGVLNAFKKI